MIKNKRDYYYYINSDRQARDLPKGKLTNYKNELYRYQKLMRKTEYYNNCRNDFFGKIYLLFLKYHFKKLSIKYDFSIPLNTFGPGLCILHRGTIVVNNHAQIGKNCRLNACVNIGTQMGKENEVPIIGDNVFIGPGVKMFGKITIGNNVAIGANSVVNKSFENDITIAGVPAKIINAGGGYKRLIQILC